MRGNFGPSPVHARRGSDPSPFDPYVTGPLRYLCRAQAAALTKGLTGSHPALALPGRHQAGHGLLPGVSPPRASRALTRREPSPAGPQGPYRAAPQAGHGLLPGVSPPRAPSAPQASYPAGTAPGLHGPLPGGSFAHGRHEPLPGEDLLHP
jgi:hypothetical protein